MLRTLKSLEGALVEASGRVVGRVGRCLLDPGLTAVRWLVVNTVCSSPIPQALISPRAIAGKFGCLALSIDSEGIRRATAAARIEIESGAKALVDSRVLWHVHVHATDGAIGRVVDLVIDDESWRPKSLVVDTGDWLLGQCLPTAVDWIDQFDWAAKKLTVRFNRQAVRSVSRHDDVATFGPHPNRVPARS